jgi:hypothetical protein
VPFVKRRRVPPPPLAEMRRGGKVNLLPRTVVAGSVRIIEFLLVALIGFGIYLGYVEREGMHTHIIYLIAVLIAATATTLTFEAFSLYEIPTELHTFPSHSAAAILPKTFNYFALRAICGNPRMSWSRKLTGIVERNLVRREGRGGHKPRPVTIAAAARQPQFREESTMTAMMNRSFAAPVPMPTDPTLSPIWH